MARKSSSSKGGGKTSTKNTRTTRPSSAKSNPKTGSRKRSASRASAGSQDDAFDGAETMDPEKDAAARQALLASDKLYYRIGEVSRLTGVKAHVLRYWETEFRWMAPPKSRSKQRLYRKRDIEFVWLLKRLLWGERYTLAGARQRIQELGVDEALALLDQPSRLAAGADAAIGASAEQWGAVVAALDEMQAELLDLRGALQEA